MRPLTGRGAPLGARRLGGAVTWLVRARATGTSLWADDVWVIDSTPIECARSRDAVRRSELAGWAEYGYCASHSRPFWGLRLHAIATPAGAGWGARGRGGGPGSASPPTHSRYFWGLRLHLIAPLQGLPVAFAIS